jgi:alkaline phosphatase D
VPVAWEVAEDEGMRRVVRSGTAVAGPEEAHALHVEPAGLAPDRWYWYRFRAGDAASAVGRARTAPAPGAKVARLRLDVASCSDWQQGYFSAYRHMAADSPDLVLFLGDYIYEFIEKRWPAVRLHSNGVEAKDLRTYRNRYAQYRTDPDLQALHAAAPCLATWDDHEVQNDYADSRSQDLADPGLFRRRRAAAYRAFWEHMPLRGAARPRGPDMMLHRTAPWGDLARVWMLDGRQYRSRLACPGARFGGARVVTDAACPERLEPARTMLGAGQERWLGETLAAGRSRWSLFGQGTLMAELEQPDRDGAMGHWTDAWSGYPAARARFLTRLRDTAAANPVVLSGDIHSYWANDLRVDPADLRAPPVATEFVTTSITSVGPDHAIFAAAAARMPHVHFFDSRYRGYTRLDLAPDRLLAEFRTVSDVKDPNATIRSLARFAVESGRPGVIRL